MNVIEYCTEEVSRQGHDVTQLDGIQRVGWMLDAWAFAIEEWSRDTPSMAVIRSLGMTIEPNKNRYGFRVSGVRVGDRVCPPAEEVVPRLKTLLEKRPAKNTPRALDFYREFEMIHPFIDGNGRTGKILLNWLNSTLLDPIFPPNDFWGKEIRNP